MKTSLIHGMLIVLALIVISSTVFAAENSCWTCVKNGRACTSTCDYSKCSAYECLDTPLCACTDDPGGFDVDPPQITLVDPVEDEVYSTTNIPLEVQLDEQATYIRYSFDGRRYMTFCTNCKGSRRTLRLSGDGIYNLEVEAKDGHGNLGKKNMRFVVDTKAPEIHDTYPEDGDYLAGQGLENFTVDYTESDVAEMMFHHQKEGQPATKQSVNITGQCEGGKKTSCTISLDMTHSQYDQGDRMSFYFTLRDANSMATSDLHTVTINASFLAQPIKIFSPKNGHIYDTGRIAYDLDLIKDVDVLTSSEDGKQERTLCRSCDSYTRSGSFRDGTHVLNIYAYDNDALKWTASTSFEVDSKPPRISRTEPRKGDYANGVFVVKYNEENLKNITLTYGNDTVQKTLTRYNCPSNTRGECTFEVPMDVLAQFHDQVINYWFTLQDSLRVVESDHVEVIVDAYAPTMDVFSPKEIPGERLIFTDRKVFFDIELGEIVKSMYFKTEGSTRQTRLCSRCSGYSRDRSFRDGHHVVTIFAEDYAGNVNSTTVEFWVDTKAPRVTQPRRGRNDYLGGEFEVSYNEDNPENVTLYLSARKGTVNWSVSKYDCEGSSRGKCVLNTTLTGYDGEEIDWWFTVLDLAGNLVGVSPMTGTVDAVPALMEVHSPTDGDLFDRRMNFHITLNEVVTSLTYAENDGRPITLCRNCDEYSRVRSLRTGTETLTFVAVDHGDHKTTQEINLITV